MPAGLPCLQNFIVLSESFAQIQLKWDYLNSPNVTRGQHAIIVNDPLIVDPNINQNMSTQMYHHIAGFSFCDSYTTKIGCQKKFSLFLFIIRNHSSLSTLSLARPRYKYLKSTKI